MNKGIDENKTYKEIVIDVFLVLLGSFILAVASAYFILPFEILTGGVAGIAVVITELTGLNSMLVIYSLMGLLFLMGAVVLGKGFAYKTILSSIAYPFFLFGLSFFPHFLQIDLLLASIYTGILMGLGVGIVLRTGASTGGMDIPPLIIHKYTNINLSTLFLVIDGMTVILGLISFGLEKALIGLISVYISTIVIDKVMLFGGTQSKSIHIISEKYEEINKEIQLNLARGTTILTGTGGYTNESKAVIFVVVSQKQYPELHKLIHHIDPHAFVVVADATEVAGEGFTYENRV